MKLIIAMHSLSLILTASLCLTLMGCQSAEAPSGPSLEQVAESYVKLALAVGQHDPAYVDAYYGPEEWTQQAEAGKLSPEEIRTQTEELLSGLREPVTAETDELTAQRRRYLSRQLESLVARVEMLAGKQLSFDEESLALYDAVAPSHETDYYQSILDELERLLAEEGFAEGALIERYEAFREDFIVPAGRVAAVFETAIAACRERTATHIALPEGESFEVEYVTGQSWG
ncbi:MAG: hypothetical protein GY856_36180, partial [bacterium]|nr:hypothetical protein [bacterium]